MYSWIFRVCSVGLQLSGLRCCHLDMDGTARVSSERSKQQQTGSRHRYTIAHSSIDVDHVCMERGNTQWKDSVYPFPHHTHRNCSLTNCPPTDRTSFTKSNCKCRIAGCYILNQDSTFLVAVQRCKMPPVSKQSRSKVWAGFAHTVSHRLQHPPVDTITK